VDVVAELALLLPPELPTELAEASTLLPGCGLSGVLDAPVPEDELAEAPSVPPISADNASRSRCTAPMISVMLFVPELEAEVVLLVFAVPVVRVLLVEVPTPPPLMSATRVVNSALRLEAKAAKPSAGCSSAGAGAGVP
jgi:hypothetical protein